MSADSYDFVVVGSGFGGSIMAMVLRRLGHSVLLVERGSHPRFVIGESSTPFANLLLERIAGEYDLPFLRHLSEWGSWREHYPELPAGLKRGFTFYHHTPGQPFDFSDRSRQLLVAASPNDRVADTHWYRPAFDAFLVEQAIALGVHYRDQAVIADLEQDGAGWKFSLSTRTESRRVQSGFMIDASGPAGFLPRQLGIPTERMRGMPETRGVYAHFRNVSRLDEIAPELRNPALPYPPDDAAVHHVFPGGWVWVLRFNHGITSVGVACTGEAGWSRPASAEELWLRLLERLPTLNATFRAAERITPFYDAPELSFQRREVAGQNWALLPSSAGFVDPLLSTGFALTLLGIRRLAEGISKGQPLIRYAEATTLDLEAAGKLVGGLYAKMARPEEFSLLTLLYFAALSFTETAWRLNKEHLAPDFLLRTNDGYASAFANILAKTHADGRITRPEIEDAIKAFDIAGLTDWRRNNWHPVNLEDLVSSAHKLEATPLELKGLFAKLGLPIPKNGF